MGGRAICFGLLVTLVVILGTENEVNGTPMPAPVPEPDICMYRHRHGNRLRKQTTTTAAPPTEDKATGQRKEKLKKFEKLLEEILEMDKEAESKKKAEEEAKKKQEEQPKGLADINDAWNKYMQFLQWFYNSL